jgi:hypothetical protein
MPIDLFRKLVWLVLGLTAATTSATLALAQEQLPWGRVERPRVVTPDDRAPEYDEQRAPRAPFDRDYAQQQSGGASRVYPDARDRRSYDDEEAPPARDYRPAERVRPYYDDRGGGDRAPDRGYGQPYEPARPGYADPRYDDRGPYARGDHSPDRTYSSSEIAAAGHRFFGRVSSGLASVIEYAFQRGGRPNGYILGEEAGGAFVAGLRYGEGVLHLKDGTTQKVYWQGPSLGYDFGAEGSKTMILVYNLQYPGQIYSTFGGVDGSAYLVGGVGITFQKNNEVTLAPIRSGVGLRLGANLGYLKYTRTPTWNPF